MSLRIMLERGMQVKPLVSACMVQPVIMMTEEEPMNSGIGNLMQQITGEVDMMTESGQPTDMGQGVGSLMMAGAPEAPAHKVQTRR